MCYPVNLKSLSVHACLHFNRSIEFAKHEACVCFKHGVNVQISNCGTNAEFKSSVKCFTVPVLCLYFTKISETFLVSLLQYCASFMANKFQVNTR